jgi:LacI family transcriptional regulator
MDVAKDAGVSRATASLVLRDSPLVADDTRDRVLASMRKLGYVYNRAAASLRTQRSQAVGLVVTDITNPFFAQMTIGSEAQLEQADHAVLLANTSDKLAKQDRLLEAMHEYGVDGILFCPAKGTSPDTIERLRRWHLPFVLVTRYLFEVEADYVGADNVLGAEMAVEHLLANGHRRIAMIGGPADSSARRERRRGYCNALERRGLNVDESLSIASPVTRDGGHRAILELLKPPDPPTAALCYNDVVAFGVMLGLQAAGRVPGEDFSVVGFDDIEEAALWRPALTTVSIAPRQIGVEAARLLLERIAGPDGSPRQTILPPKLVVRDSSCPYSEEQRLQ